MRQLAGSLFLALLFYLGHVQAQNENLTTSITDLSGALVASVMLPEATDHTDTASVDFDWDFVDWNSGIFNPYRDQDLKKPFFLSFHDDYYASPVGARVVVTSRYGWRDGRLHRGIDLDLMTGDEVYSILEGKVRYVRSHAGHGKTIVIRHENGLETVYAHLSKQLVEENQIVSKGQVIGKGGTTGNARGSHLHLEVRYEGVTINPEYLFDFEDDDRIRAKICWITEEVANPRLFSSNRKIPMTVTQELAKLSQQETPVPADSGIRLVAEDKIAEDQSDQRPKHYIIRYGDTLYSLARKYNVTVEDLCRVNGIADSFRIKAGQKLLLSF
jgi:murein DD-endopeptidase MepM/ murein hydrolase activator NlpD